jgi:hypothetical protein
MISAAVDQLLKVKPGEAIGALWHPDVPRGHRPDLWRARNSAERHGLAKIEKWHGDVLNDLQGYLLRMKAVPALSKENTIQLKNAHYHAIIRRNWKGSPKTWLLDGILRRLEARAALPRR